MAQEKISKTKIATTVIASLITGAIFGGISVIRLADTQTVVLAGHTASIAELKDQLVPRAEYESRNKSVDERLSRIEATVDRSDSKLDQLLSR